MIHWRDDINIYLHRQPVDFRKAINGLCVLVQEQMNLSPFQPALFVFCNRQRDKVKALYWDQTGFALWQKRLEKAKFQWPRKHAGDVLLLDAEQWSWLLRGFDILALHAHDPLRFFEVN